MYTTCTLHLNSYYVIIRESTCISVGVCSVYLDLKRVELLPWVQQSCPNHQHTQQQYSELPSPNSDKTDDHFSVSVQLTLTLQHHADVVVVVVYNSIFFLSTDFFEVSANNYEHPKNIGIHKACVNQSLNLNCSYFASCVFDTFRSPLDIDWLLSIGCSRLWNLHVFTLTCTCTYTVIPLFFFFVFFLSFYWRMQDHPCHKDATCVT